jgi:hypothetical protein
VAAAAATTTIPFSNSFSSFFIFQNFYLKIKKGKTGPASYLYIHGNMASLLTETNEKKERKTESE